MIDEHPKRHQMLHHHLLELSTDYATYNPDKPLSKTPIMELIVWSGKQTNKPDHEGT